MQLSGDISLVLVSKPETEQETSAALDLTGDENAVTGTKSPCRSLGRGFRLALQEAYRPAASRNDWARSVRSQVKVVKVSSPTVFCCGVRPKWP